MSSAEYPEGIALLGTLYTGAAGGTTAGLLCGGFALILQWLCGTVISYVLLIASALVTLLAAVQITIPSIIRAVENRPRADWEDEDRKPVRQEPAAVVVNHIANKRIEYVEHKRQKQAERQMEIDIPVDDEPATITMPKQPRKLSPKASEFMRDVDVNVAEPVAAAHNAVIPDKNEDMIVSTSPADEPSIPDEQ